MTFLHTDHGNHYHDNHVYTNSVLILELATSIVHRTIKLAQ